MEQIGKLIRDGETRSRIRQVAVPVDESVQQIHKLNNKSKQQSLGFELLLTCRSVASNHGTTSHSTKNPQQISDNL